MISICGRDGRRAVAVIWPGTLALVWRAELQTRVRVVSCALRRGIRWWWGCKASDKSQIVIITIIIIIIIIS